MKKFKYQKISKSKKLRYIDNYYKKKLYIVFLPGFMSDVEGQKPRSFKQYAIRTKNLVCLSIVLGNPVGIKFCNTIWA